MAMTKRAPPTTEEPLSIQGFMGLGMLNYGLLRYGWQEARQQYSRWGEVEKEEVEALDSKPASPGAAAAGKPVSEGRRLLDNLVHFSNNWTIYWDKTTFNSTHGALLVTDKGVFFVDIKACHLFCSANTVNKGYKTHLCRTQREWYAKAKQKLNKDASSATAANNNMKLSQICKLALLSLVLTDLETLVRRKVPLSSEQRELIVDLNTGNSYDFGSKYLRKWQPHARKIEAKLKEQAASCIIIPTLLCFMPYETYLTEASGGNNSAVSSKKNIVATLGMLFEHEEGCLILFLTHAQRTDRQCSCPGTWRPAFTMRYTIRHD